MLAVTPALFVIVINDEVEHEPLVTVHEAVADEPGATVTVIAVPVDELVRVPPVTDHAYV